jgi:hypothetical protein
MCGLCRQRPYTVHTNIRGGTASTGQPPLSFEAQFFCEQVRQPGEISSAKNAAQSSRAYFTPTKNAAAARAAITTAKVTWATPELANPERTPMPITGRELPA